MHKPKKKKRKKKYDPFLAAKQNAVKQKPAY